LGWEEGTDIMQARMQSIIVGVTADNSLLVFSEPGLHRPRPSYHLVVSFCYGPDEAQLSVTGLVDERGGS
jgi:hypothetical protein